jgi:CheY-like chemotaxis protein
MLGDILATHLPIAGAQKKEPAPDDTTILIKAPQKAEKHGRMLIVDDELQIREVVVEYLEREGYRGTTCATNGKEGLAAYKEAWDAGSPFDAVVSDRQMPELDGPEMFIEIKKINPAARLIFLTGGAKDKDMARLRELKPFAILEKPMANSTFIDTIERALST